MVLVIINNNKCLSLINKVKLISLYFRSTVYGMGLLFLSKSKIESNRNKNKTIIHSIKLKLIEEEMISVTKVTEML